MIHYQAVVIGVSAGTLTALSTILPMLPNDFPAAIIIVPHRMRTAENYLTRHLKKISAMEVKDVQHLEPIQKNTIYIAPPSYHLLISDDHFFNLSADIPINFSIPSIDVTFESAAEVYEKEVIGIILTGANADGALGLSKIKSLGGYTIVQDPKSAESSFMPEAAIKSGKIDYIGSLENIAKHLCKLFHVKVRDHEK